MFQLHSFCQLGHFGFSDLSKIDTLYFPFYHDKQLIIIDHLSKYHEMDYYYSQHMNSLPPYHYTRVIGNEYFIRDLNGKILQSFNSNAQLDSLSKVFKPTTFFNRKSHRENTKNLFFKEEVSSIYYTIYNQSIQVYNRQDTSFHLKMGLIDTLGTVVLPTDFEYIEEVKNVFIIQNNQQFGLVDRQLNTLVPSEFKSYLIQDSLIYFYGEKWIDGVYNLQSKRFNSLKNLTLQEFDFDRAYFKIIQNGKMGLLDANTNQILIPCVYDNVVNYFLHSDWRNPYPKQFSRLLIVSKNNKLGLVSLSGKVILDCIYDKIERERDLVPSTIKVKLNGIQTIVKPKF